MANSPGTPGNSSEPDFPSLKAFLQSPEFLRKLESANFQFLIVLTAGWTPDAQQYQTSSVIPAGLDFRSLPGLTMEFLNTMNLLLDSYSGELNDGILQFRADVQEMISVIAPKVRFMKVPKH